MVVKYYVGGDTELEKNNRKYLIEDSIFACKAALQSGYVSGGNLIIPKIIHSMFSEIMGRSAETVETIEAELYRIIYNSFIIQLSNNICRNIHTIILH